MMLLSSPLALAPHVYIVIHLVVTLSTTLSSWYLILPVVVQSKWQQKNSSVPHQQSAVAILRHCSR
jgi:hypothetical protein